MKWDVLRALAEQVGFWTDPVALAREMAKPVAKIDEALAELTYEGIVEATGRPRRASIGFARASQPL